MKNIADSVPFISSLLCVLTLFIMSALNVTRHAVVTVAPSA